MAELLKASHFVPFTCTAEAAPLATVSVVDEFSTTPTTVPVGMTCTTSVGRQTGAPEISGPIATALTGATVAAFGEFTTEVPAEILPGSVVHAASTFTLNIEQLAVELLEQRAKPGIVEAGFPTLAPSAWVELDATSLEFMIINPPDAAMTGGPAGSPVTNVAATDNAGNIDVLVAQLAAHTRSLLGETPSARVDWDITDNGAPARRTLEFGLDGTVTFRSQVTVGVMVGDTPITGTVDTFFACTAASEPLASIAVVDQLTTTTSSTTTTTKTTTTTVAAPTTATTTTTAVPTTALPTTTPVTTTPVTMATTETLQAPTTVTAGTTETLAAPTTGLILSPTPNGPAQPAPRQPNYTG